MQHAFLLPMASLLATGDETQQNVQLLVLLLVITLVVALISRPLRLPYTLVLVVVGLIIGISPLLPDLRLNPNVVLFLFLPALLFEGAWNVDVKQLTANWLVVLLLAVPGLLLSVIVVAALLHWTLGLPWVLVLLLGAMISPTDPIAVLSLFRQMGFSDHLRTIVEGESLFNDGVGAAIFELVLGVLFVSLGGTEATSAPSWWLSVGEALWLMLGGLILGVGVGIGVSRLLRLVDDHLIEMTVTVSVAYGVYLLGVALHTSGLLAVVGAGLVLGSYGRRTGLSDHAQQASHDIWEFLGYVANSFLFLFLGIQIGEHSLLQALAGIGLALVGVVIGRAAMIYTLVPLHDAFARRVARHTTTKPPSLFSRPAPLPRRWRPILLLSGLRGALSVALVLSLPATLPERGLLEGIVYGVVLVTLLGQGIGLRILLPRWNKRELES
ncbi:MAG TPA: sodium:proton antiporter [Ktedonobacteraceae bacterium]|jgi:CPA1 family monovalent cation:H+ antiporter|nr:sodium:proton antiporter [Ktedonobacteraceae bacterium]